MAPNYGYSGFGSMSQDLMNFGGGSQGLSFGAPAVGPAPAASASAGLTVGTPGIAAPTNTGGLDMTQFDTWRQGQIDGWSSKGGLGRTFTNMDGSLNMGNIGSVVQGIGALGSLWAGFQSNKIAKDSLAFQKDAYSTNLGNQIQSYNTALEDRANNRAAMSGGGDAARTTADEYISKHRLGS